MVGSKMLPINLLIAACLMGPVARLSAKDINGVEGNFMPGELFHEELRGLEKRLGKQYPDANQKNIHTIIGAVHERFHRGGDGGDEHHDGEGQHHEEGEGRDAGRISVPTKEFYFFSETTAAWAWKNQTINHLNKGKDVEKAKKDLPLAKEKFNQLQKSFPQEAPTLFHVVKEAIGKLREERRRAEPGNGGISDDIGGLLGDVISRISDGRGALRNRRPGDALDEANQAIRMDPKNADAYSLRAAANYDLKNLPAAAEDAQAALQLNPNDKNAQALFGLSDGRGGEYSAPQGGAASQSGGFSGGERINALAGAPALSPNIGQSNAFVRDARQAMDLGDNQAAIAKADRAIALNPSNTQAFNLRAMANVRAQDYDQALKDISKGLRLAPKNPTLLDTKSAILNRTKNFRGALEAANRSLEEDARDAYAYYNRANALAGMGERDGVLESLRQAASLNPVYQPTLQAALQLPEASDLTYLFPDGGALRQAAGAAGGRPQGDIFSARLKRVGLVASISLAGGLLLALGLLQYLVVPIRTGVKSVYTRITSRSAKIVSAAPAPAPLAERGEVPDTLRGQYKMSRRIGVGGMGTVYEGTDIALSRRVAIKRMRDELKLNPRERQRFVAEAKTVAALHHPHIVDIYAIVEEGDEVYLVFAYVSGKTVYDIVAAKGRLGFSEALLVFRSIASALDYAHGRGVIHRDLKPTNVMVDEEGYVKVMDFGIARVAKDAASRVSMTNTIVGTPPYMAPEQEQGVVRKESDVFALGVCLYEMLCGKLPFVGVGAGMLMNKVNKSYVPVSRMAPSLPEGIDEVMAKALEPDPDRRFHSAKEFMAALESLSAVKSRV